MLAAPFLVRELVCSDCRKRVCASLQTRIPEHVRALFTQLVLLLLFGLFFFSLGGFSEAGLEGDYGPSNMWLVGAPLVLYSKVDSQ